MCSDAEEQNTGGDDEGSVTSGHRFDGNMDMVGHDAPNQPDSPIAPTRHYSPSPNETVRYAPNTYLLVYLKLCLILLRSLLICGDGVMLSI